MMTNSEQNKSVESIAYEIEPYRRWERMDVEDIGGEGLEYDAYLKEFPGCHNVSFTLYPAPEGQEVIYPLDDGTLRKLPERIEYDADNETLETLDYPEVDRRKWQVMSRQMLDTLLSIRKFSHRAIPVVMLDCQCSFVDGDFVPRGTEMHGFVILQLLEFLDIVDRERSDCEIDEVSGRLRGIQKLVLKVPPEGLPPIFRIKDIKTYLFVSAEGKAALEANGTGRGVRFVPIEKFRY